VLVVCRYEHRRCLVEKIYGVILSNVERRELREAEDDARRQ